MWLVARLLGLIPIGLILAGCTPAPPPKPRGHGLAARAGVAVGQPAPDIAGVDLDGNAIRLSDFRGKVVLIDFWRSGCVPCKMLHASEKTLVGSYDSKEFTIVGVYLGDEENGRRDEKRGKLTWRSILDSQRRIAREWGIIGTPTVFLVDQEGVIRFDSSGLPSLEVLELHIGKLLGPKAS